MNAPNKNKGVNPKVAEGLLSDGPDGDDDVDDIFANKASLSAVEYTIDGLVGSGVTYIAGGHGIGKTNLLVPLASIVAGELQGDITAELVRKVIYFTEDPDQAQRIRYGLKKHNGLVERGNFAVRKARRMSASETKAMVLKVVKAFTIEGPCGYQVKPLIVFDTTNANFDVENENDSAQVGRIMDAARVADSPSWMAGHLAKGLIRADLAELSGRGSSAWEADAQGTAFIFADDPESPVRHLAVKKVRFEPAFYEVKYESFVNREIVKTPWGTTQAVPFRYGVPVRSSAEGREAVKAQVEESKKRIQQTKDISTVVNGIWGKGAMSSKSIEELFAGEVQRNNVRVAVATLKGRGDIAVVQYVALDGKTRSDGLKLSDEFVARNGGASPC